MRYLTCLSFRRYVRTQQLGRPTVRNPTVMDSQRLYDSVSVEKHYGYFSIILTN